jgi:hypothetical protein
MQRYTIKQRIQHVPSKRRAGRCYTTERQLTHKDARLAQLLRIATTTQHCMSAVKLRTRHFERRGSAVTATERSNVASRLWPPHDFPGKGKWLSETDSLGKRLTDLPRSFRNGKRRLSRRLLPRRAKFTKQCLECPVPLGHPS